MRSRVSETDQQNAPQTSDAQAAVSSGAPATRRGSALVLVVGTLAIIAVIAALYVTLGQADTRVSRGVERGGEIEDVERQVAQYIAKIVADERMPLPDGHRLLKSEQKFFSQVSGTLETARKLRDAGNEQVFSLLYGPNIFNDAFQSELGRTGNDDR